MLQSYTILEFLLALAVFVLVAHELNGILQARREGLSTNLSRVILRGAILVLLVIYVGFAYAYLPLEVGEGGIQEYGTPTTPWGYLLIGGLLTVLAAIESVSIVRARRLGRTSNVSRLVSHTAAFLVLLTMLGLAVRKWDRYMERLDLTIVEGPPGSAALIERRAASLATELEAGEEHAPEDGSESVEPVDDPPSDPPASDGASG